MSQTSFTIVTSALHKRLRAIPDGQVRATAREAGISLSQMARLRSGEGLNITLKTLTGLADALGETPHSLLGLPDLLILKDPRVVQLEAEYDVLIERSERLTKQLTDQMFEMLAKAKIKTPSRFQTLKARSSAKHKRSSSVDE
jgi:DNA-binding Xre family transcriptional regulator